MNTRTDVLIIGAGGAGMMCAIKAGNRGRSVVLLDHAKKVGGKILISGGGRCNFTNLGASPNQYVSQNPHFAKSALARYTPSDFIEMVQAHGIEYHEKKLGQQFCDGSAQQIVDLLLTECKGAGARFQLETRVEQIERLPEDSHPLRFRIITKVEVFECESLVIATGGLSIPKIGATGFGYDVAKQFGVSLVERAAALDGFVLKPEDETRFGGLAGLSFDSEIRVRDKVFREAILFTHAGLSGPATLQASLHWYPGDPVIVDLLPEMNVFEWFLSKKKSGNKSIVRNLLSELLPSRLSERFCELYFKDIRPLPDVSEKELKSFCEILKAWTFVPKETVGYSKAEVTRGGVDTDELSSKTLESKKMPGLFFIGEVVDVTGWLGGYNFQWAWASGAAAGAVV
ncbi:MAG: NAD(P)/FAD-dependent oxidoreductase [Bdellovibrionales bacterium]|nr:NAD(P)/FAD-dependent oxidoreductase [Bdellovibrionales bacterium]